MAGTIPPRRSQSRLAQAQEYVAMARGMIATPTADKDFKMNVCMALDLLIKEIQGMQDKT